MITAPDRLKTTTDAKPEPTTADVLRAVKALIPSEHFWCKGTPQDDEGRMCLGYAVFRAVRVGGGSHYHAGRAIRQELGTSIIAWNDAHERTYADVERVLDSAIYKAENVS